MNNPYVCSGTYVEYREPLLPGSLFQQGKVEAIDRNHKSALLRIDSGYRVVRIRDIVRVIAYKEVQ